MIGAAYESDVQIEPGHANACREGREQCRCAPWTPPNLRWAIVVWLGEMYAHETAWN